MIWLYIIILRSDNRMEYKEGLLQDYLSDHGIIHQIRCVNPHAQNGVAKWDKQHILEVARSIMFILQVPKAYWGDALLLTAYLINLLPFKALNFNTPLELLQGTSSYLVAPKVFGSTCFIRIIDQLLASRITDKNKNVFLLHTPPHKRATNVIIFLVWGFL